ncbi:hypothetical protein ACI78T_13970 [Blastococcus sp. SYSU D00922]
MSADLVAHDIDRLVATQAASDEVRRKLGSWDARALFEDLRRRSAVDEGLAAEQAAASYRHPNGFTKVRLLHSPGAWALRLHIWRAAPGGEFNDIHDHCGPFASRVLVGNLSDEVFTVEESSTATPHVELRDELVGGVHRLTPVGKGGLVPSAVRHYASGETYWMDADTLHRSAPVPPFPAMTLVVEWPRSKSISRVFRTGRRPQHEVVPTAGSPALVREALDEVIEHGV